MTPPGRPAEGSDPGRARLAPWRSLLLLLLLAPLPCVLGLSLRRAPESALSPRLPLWLDGAFREAGTLLAGSDGTRVRLTAASLRLEAAHTPGLVSSAKALVARDVLLHPVDGDRPEWAFRRLELATELGPHAWFGPVRCTGVDGSVETSEAPRGWLTIVDGTVRWRAGSR
ncbi:MAG: hypothetical protein QF903_04090 [Planctomycetota bacterium]|nr:hypothetical protein [Planctomycetota bacterium]MDP6762900.1 hypothetical protein [Planctomycetota bacterium]MDP6988638.1 hypothetical protein [Planctomycetota bacterium]